MPFTSSYRLIELARSNKHSGVNRIRMETLEKRVLYSADPVFAPLLEGLLDNPSSIVDSSLDDPLFQPSNVPPLTTTSELVVVDTHGADLLKFSEPLLDQSVDTTGDLIARYELNNATGDDSIGTADGVITNSPNFVPGQLGDALSFAEVGTNGQPAMVIDSASAPDLSGGDKSISFWINPAAGSAGTIIDHSDPTSGYRVDITADNRLVVQANFSDGSSMVLLPPTQITANTWAQVSITQTVGIIDIYIDGVRLEWEVTAAPYALSNSSSDMIFGQNQAGNSFFDGSLDDVRFYDRQLSTDDVSEIISEGVNTEEFVSTNNPIAMVQGDHSVVSSAQLLVNDSEQTPEEIFYTINTQAPSFNIFLNGTALNPADTFTQKDINDGLLVIEHDGIAVVSEIIELSVDDGYGNNTPIELTVSASENAAPTDISQIHSANDLGVEINLIGDAAYFSIDDAASLFGGLDQLTYELSLETATPNPPSSTLIAYGDNVADKQFQIDLIQSAGIRVHIDNELWLVNSSAAQAVMDGEQHTLAITWNAVSGETNLLVDGVLIDSTLLANGAMLNATGVGIVGNDLGTNNAASFSGHLHDMRLFDYARSEVQISTDQETEFGLNENGLIAYWKFDSLSTSGQVGSEVSANHLSPQQASFPGASTGTITLADGELFENSAVGTEVLTVKGIDPERDALLANLLATTPDSFYSQSAGIVVVNGGVFFDWNDAYTSAASMTLNGVSGHLAMPNSAVENALMKEAIASTGFDRVWIGAKNSIDNVDEWMLIKPGEPNVQFSDSSGSSVNGHYINWAPGEPNNAQDIERYAEIYPLTSEWNDNRTPSTEEHRYFAEFNVEDVLNGTTAAGSIQRGLDYSITQQSVAGAFAINNATGVISVADNQLLNYEEEAIHIVTVEVQDNQGNAVERDFSIRLNDANDAPVSQNDTAVVDEGGDVIINVVANDVDPDNDVLTLTITVAPQFGSTSVDANNNIVYQHNGTENFSDQFEYQITDSAGEVDTATVVIAVTPVNENAPVINVSLEGYQIPENAQSGLSVGGVGATDTDTDDTVTFSLANDAGGRFAITSDGELSVVDGSLLDKEKNAQHIVIVEATDLAGNIGQKSIEIDILDEVEPITGLIGTGPYFVLESVPNGTALGLITAATSDDSGIVSFSLANSAENRFAIDAVTGILSVADASLLDFEINERHEIEIVATDATGASVSALSTVQIIDVNEEPEFLSPSFVLSVPENSIAGTSVGFVEAQDPENRPVKYAIVGGEFEELFSIDADSGELFLANSESIDFETQNQFNLVVSVTDISGQTDNSDVIINVLDVDDAAVLSNPNNQIVYIENAIPLLVSPNASISDVDTDNVGNITVVIDNYYEAEDRLSLAQSFDVDVNFDELAGQLFITGPATIADVNAVLQQVQYSNISNNPTEETRQLNLIITDASGTVEYSLVEIEVVAENDTVIGVPVITGTQEVGGVLQVDVSSLVDFDDIVEYQFQWLRDGVVIQGQTSNSYSLTDDDIDSNIAVQVSIVDAAGNIEPAVASAVVFIEDPEPEIAPAVQEEENEIEFAAVEAESLATILSSNTPESEEAEPETVSEEAPVESAQFSEANLDADGLVVALARIDFGAASNEFFKTINPISSAETDTISREIKLQSNEYKEQVGSILSLDPLQVELEEGRRLLWQADNIGMANSLNEVIENLNRTVEEKRASGSVTDALVGTSLSVTAGLLIWLLRGGALLASVFSVSPLWKQFDPLPIVNAANDTDDETDDKHQEDADVDSLFEK